MRAYAQGRKFSSVTGQLRKKARSTLHNLGSTTRSDTLWVCLVSAVMITVSLAFAFCNKSISREQNFDRSFRDVVLKWNVRKNDIRIVRSRFIVQSRDIFCFYWVYRSKRPCSISKRNITCASVCHHTWTLKTIEGHLPHAC